MIRQLSLVLTVVAAAVIQASPADAVIRIATYQGTLLSGIDRSGVFVTPGGSLAGLAYSTAYTYDTTLGTVFPVIGGDWRNGGTIYGATSPILDVAITIGGATYHYTPVTVGSLHTAGGNPPVSHYGWTNGGSHGYHYETSTNSGYFNAPANLAVGVSPTSLLSTDRTSFQIYVENAVGRVLIDAQGDYGAAVYSVTGVPEPASWALMIGGFGMIGAAVRRRRVAVS